MAKTYLTEYILEEYQVLNSGGTTYVLTFLKVSFLGLIKRQFTRRYIVPDYHNYNSYTANWDYLINEKIDLKVYPK